MIVTEIKWAIMKIKQLRESKGLTQVQLAKIIGVTSASIARWEKGQTKPRAGHLKALQKALKTTPPPPKDNEPLVVVVMAVIVLAMAIFIIYFGGSL